LGCYDTQEPIKIEVFITLSKSSTSINDNILDFVREFKGYEY